MDIENGVTMINGIKPIVSEKKKVVEPVLNLYGILLTLELSLMEIFMPW